MFIQKKVLTDIFAPSLWAKVKELNGIAHNASLNVHEKKIIEQKLKASINHDLRMWEEEQPKMVSQSAINLADAFNKMNGTYHDITRIKYSDRHIFGGTTGKPDIMFDHTTPVNETVTELTKCSSLAEVVNVLNNTSEVCIITRLEDDLLSKKGFRSKRPEGWKKCYEEHITGTKRMTATELYPLVYHVVKQAQKTEKQVFKNNVEMFNWSLNIPNPDTVSDEIAEALCTSVSQSGKIGLELYFSEKIFLEDLEITKTRAKIEHLLMVGDGGKQFAKLGGIVRSIFNGPLVLNPVQKKLLESI